MNDTKHAIRRAFIRLYTAQPHERLSVKAVCRDAPVARTTFYSYYSNLDELQDEIENDLVGGLQRLAAERSDLILSLDTLRDYMDDVIRYIASHWDANRAFLVQQPNDRYARKWKDAICQHLDRRLMPGKTPGTAFSMAIQGVDSAMLGIYTYWLRDPVPSNTNDVAELTSQALHVLCGIV